ncbi:hypothetical protein K502DRAFT_303464 [Neoconidiobolus thromboides FSU 785]|nr:hypothetical protein K502DRAFT_303464 [Neoconidiobolus thromboides FSU 785]
MILSMLLIISSMTYFGVRNVEMEKNWELDVSIISSFVQAIAMVVVAILSLYTHKSVYHSSTILLVYWPFSLLLQFIQLRTMILMEHNIFKSIEFIIFFINLLFSVALFAIECYPKEEVSDYIYLEGDIAESPEEKANIYSFLTFSWMSDLLKLGYSKHLVAEDLWVLPKAYQVTNVAEKFSEAWENEKRRTLYPNLSKTLLYTFGAPFLFAGVLKGCQDVLGFFQPTLLRYLISFIKTYEGNNPSPIYYGIGIAFSMLFTAIAQTMFLHQYFQLSMVTGMKLRSALVTAIYQKALKLSSASGQTSTVGEIVNHMSVDAQRIQDLCNYAHVTWSGVFQIAMALTLLYQQVGVSVFAGFALMVLAIPFNFYIGSLLRKLQQQNLKNKDMRIKLIDELLSGIKVIKLYAWEKSFLAKLFHVRNDLELKTLRKYATINCISTFTSFSLPQFVSLVTFAAFALVSGEPLTAEIVFVSLSLLNLLSFPLNMLPYVLTATVEASVSLNRIYNFLTCEELDPQAVKVLPRSSDPSVPAIEIENGCFTWGSALQPTIGHVSLKVKTGELFTVVGKVGSGKSSFISAILGDMNKVDGTCTVRGRVAYVPQQPWIMNATVRDNITFGHRYDPEFYEETIRVCALQQDLEMLISGDLTEIGEKGINLSGGQKARISLARAVYARADVYLLDDPLSAVDAHVGKHIFENAIGNNGILRSKTRVLVTHAVHFLPFTDKIAMFENGEVKEFGTFDTLSENPDSEIHKLIAAKSSGPEKVEESEEELLSQLGKSLGGFSTLSHDEETDHNQDIEDSATVRRHASRVSYISLRPPSIATIRKIKNRKSNIEQSTLEEQTKSGKQMTIEESAQGSVSADVYWTYFKSCTYSGIAGYIVLTLLAQGAVLLSNLWLKRWSENPGEDDIMFNIGVYGVIGFSIGFITMFQFLTLYVYCSLKASKKSHNEMLMSVVRAPMSFFDTTPLGRIVNRFSKDQSTIDEVLPRSFGGYFGTLVRVFFVVGVISYSTPPFLGMVVLLSIVYFYVQKYYLQTSRELKRLDSVSRSPIYTHFQETLGGASTIRAYRQQQRFINENENRLEMNLQAYYPSMSLNRWLAVRLEFLGSIIIFSSALLAVLTLKWGLKIDPAIVGLSVSYALNVTQSLNWCIRMYCEIETNIVSMERIKEYVELPSEATYEHINKGQEKDELDMNTLEDSNKVVAAPANWPTKGEIEFSNYSTRYREGLDLVLNNISLTVKPHEKVGIVGRTGAGKSSLTLALFRVVEAAEGNIKIDGVDISKIPLFDLRSKLSIIPQDPVLFAGKIRENLDPFGTLPDADLWEALEHANLKEHVSSMDGKLDAEVSQGGENFSVGQRQLICLARALLRKSSILVLDEATAAIDIQTDNLIQKTIREEFSQCTVITIAHRINTVIDGDKILVLDKGRVAEFDTPANLLSRKDDSLFYSLAKEAGLA